MPPVAPLEISSTNFVPNLNPEIVVHLFLLFAPKSVVNETSIFI